MAILLNPQFQMMFNWVLKTSLLASVMIVLIVLMKAVLKNRLSPGWHYALWLLLMVRLLIPAGPQSPVSIYNLLSWPAASENALGQQQSQPEPSITQPIDGSDDSAVQAGPSIGIGSDLTDHANGWPFHEALIAVWLGITLLLLIRLLLANILFSVRLRKSSVPAGLTDKRNLAHAKKTMGVRRHIRLSYSEVVTTPTLFGWFRPHLIMPESSRKLDETKMFHIYLHELAHVKRGDILVNWLMHLLMAIHWFNPLLWYSLYKMREDQELSADALALRKIKPSQITEYGHTIITLLEHYKLRVYVPGTARLSGSKQQLKRRILMIKTFKRKSLGWTIIGLTLVIALSGCTLTNGKTSGDEAANQPPVDTTSPGDTVIPDPTTPDSSNSGNAGAGDAAQNGSDTKSGSGSSVPSSSQGSNKGGASSSGSEQPTLQPSDTKGHEQQIKDIVDLAKKGMVKGADFVSGKTTIEDVHDAWGKPDRPWQSSDRYAYDTYSPGAGRGSYAFGIGRGEVVYDIRYFGSPMDESQSFNQISFTEIKRTLGKPSSVKTSSGDDILNYKLGDYELKFVGPHQTQRLDHISVYSPRAAATVSDLK